MDIVECIEDVSLWAMDEAGKQLESNNFRSWSLKGKPTIIEKNGFRGGINIIGATTILNDFKFIYKAYVKGESTIAGQEIIEFLKSMMEYDRSRGRNLSMVILDNARIHRAQDVRKFAKEHKDKLMIIFQPKYSPELNPQENMWNWMKQFMQQASAYKNAQELIIKLEEFAKKANNNADEVKNMVYARKFYK